MGRFGVPHPTAQEVETPWTPIARTVKTALEPPEGGAIRTRPAACQIAKSSR